MNTLTKWNPFRSRMGTGLWRPFEGLGFREPFNRLVEDMEKLMGAWPVGSREAMTMAEWEPLVDITEDEKEYLVKAELPEVSKDNVKVTVQDGVLTIAGERKVEKEEKGKKYHRIERAYGSFERSFTLPDDADAKTITSEFKDGVLKVHLPKSPAAKPETIDVKVQ